MPRCIKISDPVLSNLLEKEKSLEQELRGVKQGIRFIRERCDHRFVPDEPYDPSDKWFSSGGSCENCGDRLSGWWCPKSKSGECDYKQPDGSYDDDNCIHCGMPDERK